MNDAAQTTKALTKWAVKEMKFLCSSDTEKRNEVSHLNLSGICLGPLVDIWSYIIKHVKSDPEVLKIQGNLKLHAQTETKKNSKSAELLKEREKLRQEVAELEKSTNILRESVKETSKGVQEQEKVLHLISETNKDYKRSAQLLNKHKNQMQDQAKDLNKKIHNLENSAKLLVPDFDKELGLNQFKIDIESMCRGMEDSLNELINKEPNMDKIYGFKLEIGKSLAALLQQLPHPLFVKLMQEQQEAEVSLKKAVESSVPFPQDERQASFTPEEVQPLQKLLYDLSWFHTQCCSRASKAKRSSVPLKKEMVSLRSDLEDVLDQTFGAEEKSKAMARHWIDLEIEAAGRQATMASLRRNLDELEAFCWRCEASQAEIERKIATIEANSRVADDLSLLICTLARKHANNGRSLQQSVERLQRLATEDLRAAHLHLVDCVRASQADSGKELELYKQLKPRQLLTLSVDRKLMPVHRLTMNRLLPLTSEWSAADGNLEVALQHLDLHRFVPLMDVLQAVGRMKGQTRRLQRTVRWHEARRLEVADKYGLTWLQHGTAHAKELAKELRDKRQKQENDILPSLESRQKKMDEVALMFNDIQTALSDWSEEPAKKIDTGRLVNGENLEHYHKQWNKALAMCRKKN